MHAGHRFTFKEYVVWTRRNIGKLFLFATIPTALYEWAGWYWIALPWEAVTLIGTAAAFITGFKNNAAYDRLWEARRLWGSIVNSSRSWGIMVKDFIGNLPPEGLARTHQTLIYRHVAWLTALRFQLRENRYWENARTQAKYREYLKNYRVMEWEGTMEEALKPFLSCAEFRTVLGKKNPATHLISLQSAHLRQLHEEGVLNVFPYVNMVNLLNALYDHQGGCERIKNFPYPRQFVGISVIFIHLFIIMVPLGMVSEFKELNENWVWLNIPFSVMVSWVFTLLESVGESTENPFEGLPNDVPITALSRTIEIDLREMLDEKDLPSAITPVNHILT